MHDIPEIRIEAENPQGYHTITEKKILKLSHVRWGDRKVSAGLIT